MLIDSDVFQNVLHFQVSKYFFGSVVQQIGLTLSKEKPSNTRARWELICMDTESLSLKYTHTHTHTKKVGQKAQSFYELLLARSV